MRWEGKYYNVDGTGNVKDPLLFLIVNSPIHTASTRGSHDRLFFIPTTWMSDEKLTFSIHFGFRTKLVFCPNKNVRKRGKTHTSTV